uniref:Uncharacterized protein n=1 Tax=Arundo donax TaxID=35708 RepID=A0A0A9CXD9_ARUDO
MEMRFWQISDTQGEIQNFTLKISICVPITGFFWASYLMEIIRYLGTRSLQRSFHLYTLVLVGKAFPHEIFFVHSVAFIGFQSPILVSIG